MEPNNDDGNKPVKKHPPKKKKKKPEESASKQSTKPKSAKKQKSEQASTKKATSSKSKPKSQQKEVEPNSPNSRALVVAQPLPSNPPTERPAPSSQRVPPISVTSTRHQQEEDEKREREREEEDRYRRRFAIVCCIICCLLFLLALGLILGLVVFKNDKNPAENGSNQGGPNSAPSVPSAPVTLTALSPTPASFPTLPTLPPFPTRFPTIAPIVQNTLTVPVAPPIPAPIIPPSPVQTPTSLIEPTPTQFVVVPYADTSIHKDGFTPFESFGSEDTLDVQNGPLVLDEVADIFALIAFDLSQVPSSASKATLQLFHVAQPKATRGSATLNIRLLPSTRLIIETLHSGLFNPADDVGVQGPSFTVNPNDEIVQIDVSSLVFPISSLEESDFYIMIENRGQDQDRPPNNGDSFYSRETNDPPQLIFDV